MFSASTAVFRPFQSPSPSRRFSFRRGLSRTGGPIRGGAASASVYLMCGLAWAGTGEIRSAAHFETRELKAVAEPGQAVLELCYLHAFPETGAVCQPVCLGPRDDISAAECMVDQLKFKRQEEGAGA